jgi:ABC-type transport system involved in multi-copper enzyme maturation permease subunit
VNATLLAAFLRQRFSSPMRLVLLGLFGWTPMLPLLLSPAAGFSMLGDGYFIAIAIGAGMIGQEVASGTLPLMLTRPVTRSSFVISRWLGTALAAWLVMLAQALTAVALIAVRGAGVPWDGAGLFLANGALGVAGAAAILALLSALVDGLGDLGVLLMVFVSVQVAGLAARVGGWGWLARAAQEIHGLVQPHLDVAPFLGPAPVSWFEVVSYLSTVTLCLALAIVVLNRRELSYASTGA